MGAFSALASRDQPGSQGSGATNTAEQLLHLAPQFILLKAACRSSGREDQSCCSSTKLLASET